MEGRIMHLARLLTDARIIDDNGAGATGSVALGSVVTILYDGDDEPENLLVGLIEEQRDGVTVVSPGSPMGEALLGAAEGDAVEFESPAAGSRSPSSRCRSRWRAGRAELCGGRGSLWWRAP